MAEERHPAALFAELTRLNIEVSSISKSTFPHNHLLATDPEFSAFCSRAIHLPFSSLSNRSLLLVESSLMTPSPPGWAESPCPLVFPLPPIKIPLISNL